MVRGRASAHIRDRVRLGCVTPLASPPPGAPVWRTGRPPLLTPLSTVELSASTSSARAEAGRVAQASCISYGPRSPRAWMATPQQLLRSLWRGSREQGQARTFWVESIPASPRGEAFNKKKPSSLTRALTRAPSDPLSFPPGTGMASKRRQLRRGDTL